MKYKTIGILAILGAVVLFLNSILFLLGFAVSTGAIKAETLNTLPLSGVLLFVLKHFNLIAAFFAVIMLLVYFGVYFGFARFGAQLKNRSFQYASYFILISFLISSLLTLLLFFGVTSQSIDPLQKIVEFLTFTACIWFGISLLKIKHSFNVLLGILGVFYIVQGFAILSNLFLPIRIIDFSIAIMIALSFLFFNLKK